MTTLVLASTSAFRRGILEKLRVPFTTANPELDETALPGETPDALVQRLAEGKARAVADQFGADTLIIGSDQLAVIDDSVLGKPGNFDNAFAQLRQSSGRVVEFRIGLCLLDNRSGKADVALETFRVHFNELSDAEITAYLNADQPYQSAGSFKSEGLGIALFNKLEGDDPNTLIGLPLIRLTAMLKAAGYNVLHELQG